jgi:hypothetical protein
MPILISWTAPKKKMAIEIAAKPMRVEFGVKIRQYIKTSNHTDLISSYHGFRFQYILLSSEGFGCARSKAPPIASKEKPLTVFAGRLPFFKR